MYTRHIFTCVRRYACIQIATYRSTYLPNFPERFGLPRWHRDSFALARACVRVCVFVCVCARAHTHSYSAIVHRNPGLCNRKAEIIEISSTRFPTITIVQRILCGDAEKPSGVEFVIFRSPRDILFRIFFGAMYSSDVCARAHQQASKSLKARREKIFSSAGIRRDVKGWKRQTNKLW